MKSAPRSLLLRSSIFVIGLLDTARRSMPSSWFCTIATRLALLTSSVCRCRRICCVHRWEALTKQKGVCVPTSCGREDRRGAQYLRSEIGWNDFDDLLRETLARRTLSITPDIQYLILSKLWPELSVARNLLSLHSLKDYLKLSSSDVSLIEIDPAHK